MHQRSGPSPAESLAAEHQSAAARIAAAAIAAAEARQTAIQAFLTQPDLDAAPDDWDLTSPQTLLYLILGDSEDKGVVLDWLALQASQETALDIWGNWSRYLSVPGGEGRTLQDIHHNVMDTLTTLIDTPEDMEARVKYLADIVTRYGTIELFLNNTLADLVSDWYALLPTKIYLHPYHLIPYPEPTTGNPNELFPLASPQTCERKDNPWNTKITTIALFIASQPLKRGRQWAQYGSSFLGPLEGTRPILMISPQFSINSPNTAHDNRIQKAHEN